MKLENKEKSKELLLLGIHPFLALPYMFKNLKKRREYQIITFSLFFAILGYFFVPPKNYDLYQRFEYYTKYTPSMFMKYNDFYLGALTVIGRTLGLKENILGFVSAFILYYYLLKIGYETTARKIKSNKKYVIYMIIYALSVPLVFFNGVRFPVGYILYVYGIYSYYYKNERKKAYIYMTLGALAHYSIYLFIFLFLIFEFIFSKIKDPYIWKGLVLLGFVIGSSPGIMTSIIVGLGNFINFAIGHEVFSVTDYVTGDWGTGQYAHMDFIEVSKQIIMLYSFKLVFLLHSLLRKPETSLYKYTIFLSAVTLLVAPFFTLFERLSKILIILILVLNTNESFLEKKVQKTNVILSAMIFLFTFVILFEIKEETGIFITSYIANPIISGFRILAELIVN
ncbi:MAG: hypothetical protein DSY38_00740 [Fusobacteria bacterium]|nr:MAG: hypothetical protein DSY38_00740 [Fusobacteriota bacterium]